MANMLQMTFSKAFSWINIFKVLSKFCSYSSNWHQVSIYSVGAKYWAAKSIILHSVFLGVQNSYFATKICIHMISISIFLGQEIMFVINFPCPGTCTWWRHHMESCSALLALCVGNSPVTDEFPSQRLVMQSFDVFFDLHPNKQLSNNHKACD